MAISMEEKKKPFACYTSHANHPNLDITVCDRPTNVKGSYVVQVNYQKMGLSSQIIAYGWHRHFI